MNRFLNWLKTYFTKRNTFKIVVIELIIIGLLLCAVLAMSVQVDVKLQGDAVMTVEKGDSFEDPGAIARADGREVRVKVAGQVDTQTPGTYQLRYRARYLLSSAEIGRTVHVVDTRPPVLTLRGDSEIKLTMGGTFEEPGYHAVDSDGRDITANVQVDGEVNIVKTGTYVVTYTVTDAKGRTTTAQRTVVVEAAKQPEVVQPEGKVIYLTFDDGPRTGKIDRLLEILDRYQIKATFFVQGSNSNLAENLQAIAAAGHSVGIHTMTHDYKTIYANEDAFLKDLYGMQALIQQHTGIITTLMRFPGGTSNGRSDNNCNMQELVNTVTGLGFQYFDWNVDSDDGGSARTADEVYKNVIDGIGNKKMACVLMHDTKDFTIDAVERIIQWGLEHGYSFQSLTPETPAAIFQHIKPK